MEDTTRVFEVTQFVEPALQPGDHYQGPIETSLGTFETELEAIAVGRAAWEAHRKDSKDVAWWLVKASGESLARWIADSRSPMERVLDLSTQQLIEVKHA